jgi:hypothetical protein
VPTYTRTARFRREYDRLEPESQRAFRDAVRALVEDLAANRPTRPGLRVRQLSGFQGVYEFTFAPDGRATFAIGLGVRDGHQHIVWRRIGTHDIFRDP